ncbi:glutamate synthase-related protein [Carboxydothermus pertinax]|uniref:glutamate synthase (NADPH) n=1 Tax=Carboxydothermus pertinax TaxID=870242 RepID=A0A1L8CSP8_9THEO|nr:glutamate synthase-related protein [Carboxydothermus pertinax]GAV21943.1 glutamate synthase [Carboxydothermus pertinax]
MANLIPPRFKVVIDYEKCRKCKRCVINCGFGVYSFSDRVIPDHKKCVSCQRCVAYCPEEAITIIENPNVFRPNSYWTMEERINIMKQASSSGMLLTGMGNDRPYKNYFDHLLIDACQVTNPSIDPLREPMELTTYLGSKPDAVKVKVEDGQIKLDTKIAPQIKLDTPIIFSPMSYGSISLNAHKALARAAKECGILMNTGEGGLHKDLYPYKDRIIVQVASGRFGVNQEYLDHSAVVEIKIGQGAKPGIGGHLPGEKVNREVSETRMIPEGTDALSPAPHHDIYSIEDLAQLIYALKEATNYEKPVSVKIAAVHNVAAIASGIARAGADIIYIDGFRGGTGAAPTIIRDHIGIPIELAIAAVDDRLRAEGIRNSVSIVAAGGFRHSGDVAKAIALGADAVAIGTAALIAMGCHVCQMCHTGNCSWGIATQRPELTQRLDPDWAAGQLINLIKSWSLELKEILGALGLNAIESLRGSRERLRGIGLTDTELAILGVKHAGR